MAASGTFVAGTYSITFDGQNLGSTEVGFEWTNRPSFVPIRIDESGQNIIDGIFTGVEDMIVTCELLEWSTAAWAKVVDFILNTEGTTQAAGQLIQSNLAASLVLAPVTGNASVTYTFAKAYPLMPTRTVFSGQRLRTTGCGFYVFVSGFTSFKPTLYSVS